MTSQAQVTGFDIADLETNNGPVTHKVAVIEDLDGNPVTGFIIVGKNSQEYQEASQAIRIENIKRAAKRKTQIDTSTDLGATVVARTVASNDKTIALAVVVGWFGMLSDGKEIPLDKAVVEKMFTKYPTWQDKVLKELDVEANFTKA
jgi:hypothetical protein